MVDIGELRKLAEAATPGPWAAWKMMSRNAYGVVARHAQMAAVDVCGTWDSDGGDEHCVNGMINSAYIAAANPATIIALCDEVERLRARVAEVELANEHAEASIRDATEKIASYVHVLRSLRAAVGEVKP